MAEGLNHWAISILVALWRGCWQGTLLIVAIWAVNKLIPSLPARFRYGLWWLGCAKLMAGLLISGAVTVAILPVRPRVMAVAVLHAASLPASYQAASAAVHSLHSPVRFVIGSAWLTEPVHSGMYASKSVAFRQAVNTQQSAVIQRMRPDRPVQAWPFVFVAWLLGVAGYLTAITAQALRLRTVLIRAKPCVDEPTLADIQAISDRLGTRPPMALIATEIDGPCVAGLFRPAIVLPANGCVLSRNEMRLALAHEIAHIKRGDLWLDVLPKLTCAPFWFLPAAWLAARGSVACREEACDAIAVGAAEGGRAAYGAMLLKAAGSWRGLMGSIGISGSAPYRQMRARLTALAGCDRRLSPIVRIVGAAVVALTLASLIPWKLTARTVARAAVVSQLAAVRYAIADLGPIAGDDATFFKLNEHGDVIGTSDGKPFLWRDQAGTTPLATLNYKRGRAGAVNNQGVYAVTYFSRYGNPHAYVWHNGPHAIHGLPGYRYTVARSMNDAGWIAGSAQTTGQEIAGADISRAVLITESGLHDLGTLGGPHSAAYAVNDSGLVVGKSDLPADGKGHATHAFLWQNGSMHDLGVLGGRHSLAYSLNNSGLAVGYSEIGTDGRRHACLWQDGRAVDLGALPGDSVSEAHGLNDHGQVVGTSDITSGARNNRAILWQNGLGVDLNRLLPKSAAWHLEDAMSINNHGQIVGKGKLRGVEHAFRLTPTQS